MKSRILFVATIGFGLMMVNSGLNKFFHYMPMPEVSPEMMSVLMAFMTIKWIFPLVGIAEIVGGILIVIPRYRALGAIVIFPVMVGIIIQHATHDISGIGIGLVLFAINLWVILEEKEKFLPMVTDHSHQKSEEHALQDRRPIPAQQNA